MNRIAEALKHAVITDDDNTLARVVRENLPAIVKALDTVDEVNTALMRITQPVADVPSPSAWIIRPASAGPRMRARLKLAELRPTALVRSSGPTISDTNDWRAGASNAEPTPNTVAMT